jgi:flagellar motor component MotA
MILRYDSDGQEVTIKTPILVSLFRALGWLVVIATVFVAVAMVRLDRELFSIPAVFIVSGSGGLVALVFFGGAQLLMSIARIEHHASTEKNEAILRSLHKIEGHLEALRSEKRVDSP